MVKLAQIYIWIHEIEERLEWIKEEVQKLWDMIE